MKKVVGSGYLCKFQGYWCVRTTPPSLLRLPLLAVGDSIVTKNRLLLEHLDLAAPNNDLSCRKMLWGDPFGSPQSATCSCPTRLRLSY
jgi:hypothetical protein